MRLEEKFAESSETMSVKSNDESSSELKEKCKQQELVIKELEKRRAAAKKEIKVLMARAQGKPTNSLGIEGRTLYKVKIDLESLYKDMI